MGNVLNISEQLGIGRNTGPSRDLARLSKASWEDPRFQSYFPEPLRFGHTNPIISSGLAGIADLLKNPGGISPTVSDAIRPFLANESQNIATNYRGLAENQAGAAARGNVSVPIRAALDSALGIAQERAQREARNTAIGQSEQLRRSDLSQLFNLLDILQQFGATGRGQGLQGLGAAADINQRRQAANLAFMSTMATLGASGAAKGAAGGGGGTYV